MRKLALFFIAAGFVALAADVSKTERLDFPTGGTLRLQNSNGEVSIEGWDQPGLEITTLISAARAKQSERVHIATELKGNEVVVSSTFPKHSVLARPFQGLSDSHLEYRIKVPSGARLNIEHNIGEVHITGIAGEIRVTSHMGQITVQLPGDTSAAIDAKAKLGAIDADFPGDPLRQHKFGHAYLQQPPWPSQKLYLRIGFGDITILKVRKPTVQQR